jgi:hypothetical protein
VEAAVTFIADGTMEHTEQLTPLENYCASLDRAAQHCTTLSATLKDVRTEDALLQRDLLEKWVDLTHKLDQERVIILRGQEQYQRWAIKRFKEKQERATYKLPAYQR